MLCQQPGTGQR